MKTKRILTTQAMPGMVVADDIYTFNNQLIISKNATLTNRIITRLKFYSIVDIRIILEDDDPDTESTPKMDDDPELKVVEEKSIHYSDQIRSTLEYKQFNTKFTASLDSLKSTFQQFSDSNTQEVNVDTLLDQTSKILAESRNGFHVFHMLQCMRDYDDLTYVHSLNVSLICNVMGHWYNFSQEDIKILTMAGMLHDLGKLDMPQHIIAKPGTLTPNEYDIIKTHPFIGYNKIKDKPLDSRIKNAVLMHHERCNGTGYPNHLRSNQIDDFAKIVAIADTYDAMTSARIYRGPICPFDVIGVFESDGLQKFDPKYLLPFLEEMVQTYINCNVRLSNGAEGQVIMINKHALARPIVRIKNVFLDLSKMHAIHIASVI